MAAKRKSKQKRKRTGGASGGSVLERVVQIVTGLSMALFVVAFSVTLALNSRWLYEQDIRKYDLAERTKLNKSELMQEYDTLVKYNDLFGPETLSFTYFDMSKNGRQHFEEVRAIFHGLQKAGIAAFLIMLLGIGFLAIKKAGIRYLLIASVAPLAVLGSVLLAYFVIGWDRCFVLFHKLFFNNDYWIFDEETDPVINALPEEFFLHEAALGFSVIAIFSVLELFAYLAMRKR